MKNLSVKVKMAVIGIMMIAFMLFSINFSVSNMRAINERILQEEEENIRKDYDDSIRQQVEMVVSLLDAYKADIDAGVYTMEEGMKLAADKIRELRYGEEGYFWIDQSDGVNIVLLGNEVEGTNRIGTKDVTGYEMVKEFIQGAVAEGSCYTDYQYPKEGETDPMPKRAYTQYYEPFDWVIGTGNYVDNMDKQVAESAESADQFTWQKIRVFLAVCLLFGALIVVYLFATIINITRPLKLVGGVLQSMSEGDFTAKIDGTALKRRDDFGKLLNILEKMRTGIGGLISDVKKETGQTTESVNGMTKDMARLNQEVEDVSTTTTQLSASMEETAATANSIDEMTKEIEYAARNIAERAQEGAGRAEVIHKKAADAKNSAGDSKSSLVAQKQSIEGNLQEALVKVRVVSEISTLAESIMENKKKTKNQSFKTNNQAAKAREARKSF